MSWRVNQVLWAQWRERMERHRASGLTIAEFCRREGVSSVTFHTWKRKLQSEAGGRLPAAETGSGRKAAGVSDSVSLRDTASGRRRRAARAVAGMPAGSASFLQLPMVGLHPGPWIELTLVDGTIVRIPQQNLAALQAVFTILRGGVSGPMADEVSHA